MSTYEVLAISNKGDDFTKPKPITHQAAWALLHKRLDICEKHI